MNEAFVSRIRRILDHGAANLPAAMARRLHEAREKALARHRAEEPALAGAGYASPRFAMEGPTAQTRVLLAALALIVGGAISTYYWNRFQQAAEQATIDSALLADEIPFNAYLDQDFLKWLDNLAAQETS